jgi:hypothetical protein
VGLFDEFLRDTVNLNKTRIDDLEANVEALKTFVHGCHWRPKVRTLEAQGSWAHGTIIKPVYGGEFDADLLVMVDPVTGWSATDYVKKLGDEFTANGTYAQKAKTWDYCVTITYAGDRKVDLAPCVVGRLYDGSLEVCNCSSNAFERSEPTAYTAWLKDQNAYSGANSFRKVTRLLKYIRDIKTRFTCPSVLLTTLLGLQISFLDKGTNGFSDTPTTLKTVIGRLDDWLQDRVSKPLVTNPFLAGEDFAEAWTEKQYSTFRAFIHKYRGWIDEAYDADGRYESIQAWRRVFGDEFTKGEELKAASETAAAAPALQQYLSESAAHLSEIVDVVRNFGVSVLPTWFNRPKHMREPSWRRASQVSSNVQVLATWRPSHHSVQGERAVRPGEVLPRRGGLWFDLAVGVGGQVPPGYQVQWRITNTGVVALARNAGRGDFYPPTSGHRRWEDLEFRGVHIAEAFLVRMSDDTLVAQSPPFHVVIE